MPIADWRHDQQTPGGQPLYRIETPLPQSRKFLGVAFLEGVGYTKHERKAKRFDEEFGYLVVLPKGAKAWKLAGVEQPVTETELSEDSVLLSDEEDE